VTLHALPREALSLLAFSKDHPSVAPESPSPLLRRIAPSLRQSAATPPARSDLVVSHHSAGLLLVDPVRTVAAAHDPGVHRRFTNRPFELLDSRDACSAIRSFPSADSCRRRSALGSCDLPLSPPGRLSPPARLSPCSAASLARGLEARSGRRPAAFTARPLPDRLRRSRASEVHQPPYRLAVQLNGKLPSRPAANLAVFLHRRVRCARSVSRLRARCSRWLGLLSTRLSARFKESVRQR